MGVQPKLLGGEEEARLSFHGATGGLDATRGPFLVVDIGGGSTEFAVGPADGRPGEPEGVLSVDIGCVRLTEKFLHSDPPSPAELIQAVSVVRTYLENVSRDLPSATEAAQLVALVSTVSTMAAVRGRFVNHDHDRDHSVLGRERDLFRTLSTEKRAHRVYTTGLEVALADIMVGGAPILVAIMRYFEFGTCLVSEADILDGLVRSLLEEG